MLYGDYLDYWMKEYFEINYKYSTARRYKESFSNIKKELGNYKLSILTPEEQRKRYKNKVTIDTSAFALYNLIRLMRGDIM